MRRAFIAGAGLYAPGKPVNNQYFDDYYKKEVSPFLQASRNIFQRHFMSEDQATSDLIVPAAQKAMAEAGITADQLDLIIVATDTPDYVSPATSTVVQYRLGAKNAGCFDLNAACAGFVTALDVANKYIVSDEKYKNVLVIGAYGMSRFFDWNDYKVTSVFADGAGAVVLKATTDNFGILASELYADGQYHDYMGIYAGGTRLPVNEDVLAKRDHLLKFIKKIPVETNKVQWPRLTLSLLDRIQKTPEQVNTFFLTQLNIGSINETMQALKLPESKSYNIMDRYGYTGSACIPMAIADAVSQSRLKKGDTVILVGSGGGMTMAAMALTWGYDT